MGETMLISKDKFVEGLLSYIEHEVMAPLPTYYKWGLGAIVFLFRKKSEELIDMLMKSPIIKSLDVVTEDGLIDVDTLCEALAHSAETYGDVEIENQFLGKMRFNKQDVLTLKRYIGGN